MIKRSIIVALLATISISGINAQISFHAGGGYHFTHIPYKPLNQILSVYNETYQPDLQSFSKVSNLFGPEFTAGIGVGSMAANITWHSQKINTEAKFQNGAVQGLDVKLNTYSVNFGAYPRAGDFFTFGIGLGIDFGSAVFNTYYYDPLTDPYYYNPVKSPMLNIGPELQVFLGLSEHLFVYLSGYYKISAIDTDYQVLADRLIPLVPVASGTNYVGDLRNAGISTGILFSIN